MWYILSSIDVKVSQSATPAAAFTAAFTTPLVEALFAEASCADTDAAEKSEKNDAANYRGSIK